MKVSIVYLLNICLCSFENIKCVYGETAVILQQPKIWKQNRFPSCYQNIFYPISKQTTNTISWQGAREWTDTQCNTAPAVGHRGDDDEGEGHEVDQEAGHDRGHDADGRLVVEGDLDEDEGEPDDGVEGGGDGGDEVDVGVEPEGGPHQGLHQGQGHEVDKDAVEELVYRLEHSRGSGHRVILNIYL